MKRRTFLAGASAVVGSANLPKAWGLPSLYVVFAGSREPATATATKAPGIYSAILDASTGTCSAPRHVSDLPFPTSFAVSANSRYLYSTSEVGNDGKSDGGLAAFKIDHRTGGLTLLNQVPSGGGGPTFLKLDHTGRWALVADFGAARTNAFQILPDGRLGEQTASMQQEGSGPKPRQEKAHAHCVTFSPDNRFVLAADFGADKICVYRLDATKGTLTPSATPFVQVPAGTGPRQIVFHPNGRFAYLLSELIAMVRVYSWSAKDGVLTEIQTVNPVPSDVTGNLSGAAVMIGRDGRFLYTTTRKNSSIEMYSIDGTSGMLTAGPIVPVGGKSPWNAAIDPTGRFMLTANYESNDLSFFRIDPTSGDLSLLSSTLELPMAVNGIFVPA